MVQEQQIPVPEHWSSHSSQCRHPSEGHAISLDECGKDEKISAPWASNLGFLPSPKQSLPAHKI
jgi:hypothetical protein